MRSLSSSFCIRDYQEFNKYKHLPKGKFIVTIGMFDGLHKGHIFLLKRVVTEAKALGSKSLVITFWPHPKKILNANFKGHIISIDNKVKLLKTVGIDHIIIIKSDKKLLNMPGISFLKRLKDKINFVEMIVGEDFKLGYKKDLRLPQLREVSRSLGFGVKVAKKKKLQGTIISSSLIRDLILKGDFKEVKKYLGRDYVFEGRVIKGRGIGREIGYSTANLDNYQELIFPRRGVYAVLVFLEGSVYLGAANIGFRPTIGNVGLSLEIHIINFQKDIIGKIISLVFLEKLRKEYKFPSLFHLQKYIEKDIKFIINKYSPVLRKNTSFLTFK